jgi:hypothetical protein
MTSTEDLLEILKLDVLVVLDEAYIEFSSEASKIAWVAQYPNLVVLRTFSKSAGLAGLRVGYGAFPLQVRSGQTSGQTSSEWLRVCVLECMGVGVGGCSLLLMSWCASLWGICSCVQGPSLVCLV